ncbi:restriction endonuclease [Apibacter muscae]|uniref:Restriction endonuclease n=1 Tax=Apibacter muscae TaxID=2509004 RepID=A0A563DA36_9FLAO|nr:type I restriction endonuclease [Apibacter muscae]TWP23140.1 restriction endonuclease [Apibacter muscae]TWP27075.1 restriction endonuclease [Apibacter muscae]
MDFKDQIKVLGDRVVKLREQVLTEEATKNAFIMPFIKELGYDVFNPFEVVPEFVADVGIKKGEKIDYALMKDGNPIILIECKWHGVPLSIDNESQLFRYFHTTTAKFSILTNGIEYKFFSDLVEPNKMDDKPFFSFDITKIKTAQIEELKKFHKSYFDIDNITNTASELKYTNEIKKILNQEFNEPSPEFVKHFAKQVYPSVITSKVLEMFTDLTKKSVQQYISDLITERLNTALNKEQDKTPKNSDTEIEVEKDNNQVVTTEEEIEGFLIVKTILRQKIEGSRVHHRDAMSYFAILLDDNNRKTICRLYFNTTKKYLAILDENKKENKFELSSLDDIFNYSNELFEVIDRLDVEK